MVYTKERNVPFLSFSINQLGFMNNNKNMGDFMRTMQIIVGLLLVFSLLAVVGCGTKDAIVDESVICLPSEELADLQDDSEEDGVIELTPIEEVDEIEDLEFPEEEVEELPDVIEEEVEEVIIEEEEVDTSGLPKKTFTEGDLVELDITASDPDGDPLTITYSEPLDENGQWQTAVGDAGEYVITITASDGKADTSTKVLLVIESSNAAPVITIDSPIEAKEGDLIALDPEVSDVDGDDVEVGFNSPFDDNGEWQTGYDDAGTYQTKITATDGTTQTQKTVTVKVANSNREPVLEVEDTTITVTEGDLVEVEASASDEDGDDLTITYTDPLNDEGEWQTEVGDAGVRTATVTATDGDDEVIEVITITVNPSNNAPVIVVADVTVEEGDIVAVVPEVSDADGDDIFLTFDEPLDSNGLWSTGYDDSGVYEIEVTATDGIAIVTETVTVTVEDKNRPPVFEI